MTEHFEPREQHRFVGRYQPRIDGLDKASGRAEYLDDLALAIRFPGMLHARILRSPFPHARIRHMDTSRAEALPGVHCVLTYADPEVLALKPTTCSWTSQTTVFHGKMFFPSLCDRRVLSDHVTWVGDDAGAVVAAETEEIAEEALRLIKVEWEELPFALTKEDALAEGAVLIHPEINPANNLFPNSEDTMEDLFYERGDVEAGLAAADLIFEVSSRHHRADHGCLDTRGCLITWRGDKLTCWTNLYQADQTRMMIADMLELPLNKVRVICPYVGGSFGRGNTGDQVYYIYTALLAKRTGRPVRFKHTRHEDFHDTRNAVDYRVRAGVTKDGRITALETHSIADSGGYAEHTVASVKLVLLLDAVEILLPHIPAVRMTGHAVYTNTIPGSCMRGIGNIQLNMVLGLMVDTVAEELGLDPIEVAIKNFSHEWEEPPNRSLTAVLRAGAERIGWRRRRAPGVGAPTEVSPEDNDLGGSPLAGVKKRGLGFSFHHTWHAGWQEISRGRVQVGIRLNPDMSVILQAPQVETGGGANSCVVLACAEALDFLGITEKDVEWVYPVDTETGLKDMVQTDSAASYLQAEVMMSAADDIRNQVRVMAAANLDEALDEIDVSAGRITRGGEDTGVSVREVMQAGDLVPLQASVVGTMPPDKTGAPYTASFAEVEVDTGTGKVDVLRLAIVSDAGTVMHASGAEAQLIGAQVQAIGEALYEEIVYDRASGKPLTFDWVNYTMPTMLDMPTVDPVLLEVWRGAGEYGACGIGESAICCTPRAILNAIYNAVGVRINDIPVKPEKVLAGLRRKQQGMPGLDWELHSEISRCLDAAVDKSERARHAHPQAVAGDSLRYGPLGKTPPKTSVPRTTQAVTTPLGWASDVSSDGISWKHCAPDSMRSAAELLRAAGSRGRPLAGGTDLLGILKHRVLPEPPELLADLKGIAGLEGVHEREGAVVIGALTRLCDLESSSLIRSRYPALAEAAHAVGSPQLRNMGTLGGNICQEPRCWYYRAPQNTFPCLRKRGSYCPALTGDNRYHSVFGAARVESTACSRACPNQIDIASYLSKIREGDLAGAAEILLKANPIPAITGRVCPHWCETDCARGEFDEAVSIREIERFVGDHVLEHTGTFYKAPARSTNKRVAVVGSGPAGLSAAHYLRQAGHEVTVFERLPKVGGLFLYGIPPYRLPRDVVAKQVKAFADTGIEFKEGTAIDKDDFEELVKSFDAVFVAAGAGREIEVGISGEDCLISGKDFLRNAYDKPQDVAGMTIGVIGGGNTAIDVARSLLRLEAKPVVYYRRTKHEMPALDEEIEKAEEEGVKFEFLTQPVGADQKAGGVDLTCCRMELGELDESGRPRPVRVDGSEYSARCDAVIKAVAERPDYSFLPPEFLDAEGRLKINKESHSLGKGVFAGGDFVSGPATVAEATSAGRAAALAIDSFLTGRTATEAESAPVCMLGEKLGDACLHPSGRISVPQVSLSERLNSLTVEETGTADPGALEAEANRCFNCGCVAVTPSDLAPVLVALDAVVVTNEREIPAQEFFAAVPLGSTVLAPGELVQEVWLPRRCSAVKSAFEKFRLRNTIDFPILSATTALTVEDGVITDARLVFGAAAPVPIRAESAEAFMIGRRLEDISSLEFIDGVSKCALDGASCLPMNEYKLDVARALVARSVSRCG